MHYFWSIIQVVVKVTAEKQRYYLHDVYTIKEDASSSTSTLKEFSGEASSYEDSVAQEKETANIDIPTAMEIAFTVFR